MDVYFEDILRVVEWFSLYDIPSQSYNLIAHLFNYTLSLNKIIMSESKPKVLLFDIGGVCVSDSRDAR